MNTYRLTQDNRPKVGILRSSNPISTGHSHYYSLWASVNATIVAVLCYLSTLRLIGAGGFGSLLKLLRTKVFGC